MKKTSVDLSVSECADHISRSLQEKGFTIFCDVDHQANAHGADLEMPASRVLIFGNPAAGTMLMQKDIEVSLDLPLRIAIVQTADGTLVIHNTSDDYRDRYQLGDHPVLDKIESMYEALVTAL